jgi:GT2 family glycosyltransferase
VKLSIVVPYYDDLEEAVALVQAARERSDLARDAEALLAPLEPAEPPALVPEDCRVVRAGCRRGLPAAKNAALREASGELVLFLFPGLLPDPGAIDRLAADLETHPSWGGVAGRWNDRSGRVEKGYNIRSFPTFRALAFDLMFVHKLFPSNAATRRYKMLDFDHATLRTAEHANDCAFMGRTGDLAALGGFDDAYRFGWFDQVEMCRSLNLAGHPVLYQPEAVFQATAREPLINRLLADRYVDFYRDERFFIARHFGSARARMFSLLLVAAMTVRLSFSTLLPAEVRRAWIRRLRPHVDDRYIRRMRPAYRALLRAALVAGGLE